MTCYWSGILNALKRTDFERICGKTRKPNCETLIRFLQTKNTKNHNITWNGKKITKQEREENYEAVKNYNIRGIYNGHLCSPCDYFLFLISKVFEANITHYYLGRKMEYKNPNARRVFTFKSGRGHFWYTSSRSL